jgi:hypothetical protein
MTQNFFGRLYRDHLYIRMKKNTIKIRKSQNNKDLHSQLNFIHNNFAQIAEAIKFLETQNLKQSTCIDKFEALLVQLKYITWPFLNRFKQKIDAVIATNQTNNFELFYGRCNVVKIFRPCSLFYVCSSNKLRCGMIFF